MPTRRDPSFRKRLYTVMFHPVTESVVAFLIVLSVVLILLEAATGSDRYDIAGDVITAIFVVELTLKAYASRDRRAFFRGYWLDIIAVIPVFRGFRMLRLLRLLRLFRVGRWMARRLGALSIGLHEQMVELVTVVVVLLVLVVPGAVLLTYFDPAYVDPAKTMWQSFLTLIAAEPEGPNPATPVGRAIIVVLMVGGMVVFAMLTGIISAAMIQRTRLAMKNQEYEIAQLSGHIVVCGFNRAVSRIVKELQLHPVMRRHPIVLICEADEIPLDIKSMPEPASIYFMSGDYTRKEVLEKAGVRRASYAILLADKSRQRSDQDRDARTVLAALLVEDMNPDIFTVVELLNRENETHLKDRGVEEIIVLDEYGGALIATSTQSHGVLQVFDDIFTNERGNKMMKIDLPASLEGRTYGDALMKLKKSAGALVIAVERRLDGGRTHYEVNPPLDHVLRRGDRLHIITPSIENLLRSEDDS